MAEQRSAALVDHCEALEDPRMDRQKQPQLLDSLVIAICAVLCGANDWVAVETCGKAQREWCQRCLALPHGLPSHETFGRVFGVRWPEQWQECCLSWGQAGAEVTDGPVGAIDGKPLGRSSDRRSAKAAIPMVSAWATQNRLVLGQLKTAEKSNELPAIPALLTVLDVQGGIVTIDAMGCQQAIAQQIGEQGADSVLARKATQGNCYAGVERLCQTADNPRSEDWSWSYSETEERQHGRVELRRHWTTPLLEGLPTAAAWAKLTCVGRVEAERHVQGAVTIEQRYDLGRFARDAQQLAPAVRAHWGLEHCVHWV